MNQQDKMQAYIRQITNDIHEGYGDIIQKLTRELANKNIALKELGIAADSYKKQADELNSYVGDLEERINELNSQPIQKEKEELESLDLSE